MDKKLYLGIAREDITPEIGTCLYGYRPDVRSESVHDNLSVAVFAFKSENVTSIMISATVCLMANRIVNELREKISEENNIDINNMAIVDFDIYKKSNKFGVLNNFINSKIYNTINGVMAIYNN